MAKAKRKAKGKKADEVLKASRHVDLTVPQAEAIVSTILEAKPVRKVLEAHLGMGKVPKPAMVKTTTLQELEALTQTVDFLLGALTTLDDDIDNRPVQQELPV